VDASPYLFGDGPIPVSFPDGTVDRLDLIPSLFNHDVRQIRGRKRVLGSKAGQEARRGEGGGGRRVCRRVYRWIQESDVYPMDADRPVEIRRRVLKVGQQRHPAGHASGLRTRHRGKETGCEKADAPAFEQRKLLCVDLLESGVLEGTYERIFSDAFAYRHGLKVAYAASQLGCTSWTRRPDVPSDEEGAR
jgi:hypothetical protein